MEKNAALETENREHETSSDYSIFHLTITQISKGEMSKAMNLINDIERLDIKKAYLSGASTIPNVRFVTIDGDSVHADVKIAVEHQKPVLDYLIENSFEL